MHMGEVMCRRTVTSPSVRFTDSMSPISPMPSGTPVAQLHGSGMSWMRSRSACSGIETLVVAVRLDVPARLQLGEFVVGDALLHRLHVHARVARVVAAQNHPLHVRRH